MVRKLLGAAVALVLFAGVLRADEVRVKVFPDNPAVKQPAKPGEPIQLEFKLLQKDGKPGAPIQWQFLQRDGKPVEMKPAQQSSNAELIALLKKAIQILEGQGGQPAVRPPIQFERRELRKDSPEMDRARAELVKRLQELQSRAKEAPPKGESPELAKARAEVQAAEARLQQAKAALAKLHPGQLGGGLERRIIVVPQPQVPQPPKPADLEKRLERLMQEMEELRREIKSRRP